MVNDRPCAHAVLGLHRHAVPEGLVLMGAPKDISALKAIVGDIDARLHAGEKPADVISALVAEHGARHRFSGGAYHLRLLGVANSCTAGGDRKSTRLNSRH